MDRSVGGDAEDVLLRREELGAPLLLPTPSSGAGGAKPGGYVPATVRRRRLWFDNVFGILFGVFAFIVTVLALTIGVKAIVNRRTPAVVVLDPGATDPSQGERHVTYEGFKVFTGLALICTLGVVLACLWLQAMVTCAPGLIGYTLLAAALLGLFSSAAFFAGGQPWVGVLTLLVTAVALLYFQQLRKRLAFASANLRVACAALWESAPVLGVGLGLLLCQVLWGILWALALIGAATNADLTTLRGPDGTLYNMGQCTTYETPAPNANFTATCGAMPMGDTCVKCVCGSGDAAATVWEGRSCFSYKLYAGWLVVLLLGFLWGCAIIRNLGHCTVAGTVGTWWVSGGQRASSAVGAHFRRAATTSFGSICLGSLLVALVQTARSCLLAAHRANQRTAQSNAVTAMLGCLLAMVDRALAVFNRYALVYVALYGLDFMSAGAATTELFKARGISALVNDTLVEGVLTLGSVVVGLVCAVAGYLYGREAGLSHANVAILGVAGAFIGAALAMVAAALVESAVCTAFVLFAEDPQSLEISHADVSDALVQAWEDVLQGPLSSMGGMAGSAYGLGLEESGTSASGIRKVPSPAPGVVKQQPQPQPTTTTAAPVPPAAVSVAAAAPAPAAKGAGGKKGRRKRKGKSVVVEEEGEGEDGALLPQRTSAEDAVARFGGGSVVLGDVVVGNLEGAGERGGEGQEDEDRVDAV